MILGCFTLCYLFPSPACAGYLTSQYFLSTLSFNFYQFSKALYAMAQLMDPLSLLRLWAIFSIYHTHHIFSFMVETPTIAHPCPCSNFLGNIIPFLSALVYFVANHQTVSIFSFFFHLLSWWYYNCLRIDPFF